MADTPILVAVVELDLVAVRGLTLGGSTPSAVVNHVATPDAVSVALSGEAVKISPRVEIINPDVYVSSPWPGGFISNIDELVASADGQVISTTLTNDVTYISFDDPSLLSDLDTVQTVEITIRCRDTAGTGSIEVQPRIGGSDYTLQNTGTLTSSFQNIALADASWNADWTVAQLSSAGNQFYLAVTSRGTIGTVEIDAIDVRISSVILYSIEAAPDSKALALTGAIPLSVPTLDSKVAYPAEYDVTLTPSTPVLDYNLAPVATSALSLTGQPAYIAEDLVLERLNPDFATIRPGWEGFLTNIDEPVSIADGQTMYYDRASGDFASGELLTLSFPSVSSGLADTAGSTVLNIDLVARVRSDVVGAGTVTAATMFTWVYIDGVSQQFTSTPNVAETFTNLRFSNVGADQDWTEAQLNGLDFRIEFVYGASDTANDVRLEIDAVDLEITYALQSPIAIRPAVGGITLTGGDAPTLDFEVIKYPAAGSQALSGQAVTLFREDTLYPGEDTINFTQYAPTVFRVTYRLPTIGGITLTGGDAPTLDSESVMTAGSLSLTGKQPAASTEANRIALPGKRQLTLDPEAVGLETSTNVTRSPAREVLAYTGKVPVVQQSLNLWEPVPVGSLAYTGKVPVTAGSYVISVAEVDLTLTGAVPSIPEDTGLPVGAGGLTTASVRPQIGGREAQLTLSGQLPTCFNQYYSLPAAYDLTLTGTVALSLAAAEQPGTGALSISTLGTAPSLTITSSLTPGAPGLVNVTVDRDIEFIATPIITL